MTSLFIAVIAYFLDLSMRTLFVLGPWTPDILLLAVGYTALTRPRGEAYALAFIAGLAWDATLLDHIGLHSILYLFAVAFTVKLRSLLWAQYAVSRLVIGFLVCMSVRFGEVILWLSFLGYEVPLAASEQYIVWGPLVTGLLFAATPWRPAPIQLSSRTPQMLFTEK